MLILLKITVCICVKYGFKRLMMQRRRILISDKEFFIQICALFSNRGFFLNQHSAAHCVINTRITRHSAVLLYYCKLRSHESLRLSFQEGTHEKYFLCVYVLIPLIPWPLWPFLWQLFIRIMRKTHNTSTIENDKSFSSSSWLRHVTPSIINI